MPLIYIEMTASIFWWETANTTSMYIEVQSARFNLKLSEK